MNNGAYQHFLRVSNDYCETSLQRILEGQGRRVIVLNGSLPGMVLPVCFPRILCVPMHFVPSVGNSGKIRKRVLDSAGIQKAIGEERRKETKEERRGRRESWSEGENESHDQIIPSP